MNSEPQSFTPEQLLGPLTEVERKNAPEVLYTLGNPDVLHKGPRVSIVGARKASMEGRNRANVLAKSFAEAGVTVVSGLAMGIDTAAHSGAIDAGGRTIAVIGTPLDRVSPRSNTELFKRIAAEHLAISQFKIGSTVRPYNFVIRNRTMALISEATIIVEASDTSGSLSQGWEALRLGRLLFLMESVVENPNISWPEELMAYGAQVLSRENLDLLIESLHPPELDVATF